MHVEVRHAVVVTTIADEGSISRAAAVLGLPQPGVTAQLRRIERAVGGDLFVRSREGVTPTELGKRLLPRLADMVRARDAVMTEARHEPADQPALRIGNVGWTPSSLGRALSDSLGPTDVVTVTVEPDRAIEGLAEGDLSAALVPVVENQETVWPAHLRSTTIVREPVWLALPAEHPLLAKETVALPDLARLDWVRHVPQNWLHEVERQLFERFEGARPDVAHHAAGQAEAMSWVRDEGAAALVTPAGAAPDVEILPLHGLPRADRRVVWRPAEVDDLMLQSMVRAVRRHWYARARDNAGLWKWMVARPEDFPELKGLLPPPGRVERGSDGDGPSVVVPGPGMIS